MLVFHGSNREFSELVAGAWVTTDLDVAQAFALAKTAEEGGEAIVMALEANDDVLWDIVSMATGVEDERGTLNCPLKVIASPPMDLNDREAAATAPTP